MVGVFDETKVLHLIKLYSLGGALRTMVKKNGVRRAKGLVFYDEEEGHCIVHFPDRRPRVDTIVHEASHIVDYMLKAVGASARKDGEAYAYILEYMMNHIRRTLKEL